MSSGPLLLILSAFLHAAWNAIAKSSKDKESFLFLTMLLGGLLIAAWIFIDTGGFIFPRREGVIAALFAGVFEGLYFLTLSKTLKSSSLGKSYAIMRGGAMVVVWQYSSLLLSEAVSALQFGGAGLILAGLLLVNFRELFLKKSATESATSERGNLWAYICGIFIAGYHLCYHYALKYEAEPKSLFCLALLVSMPFLLWGVRHNFRPRLRQTMSQQGLKVFVTGIFAMTSFLIFIYGLQISAPGFAISLRNTSIFFAVLFSWYLKESLSRNQWIGALVIGCGAILLSI